MRLVSTSRVPVGAVLAKDVFVDPSTAIPLLRQEVALTERYRAALIEGGVTMIWVHDSLSSGIEPCEPISDTVRRESAQVIDQVVLRARESLDRGVPLDHAAIDDLGRIARRMATEVARAPRVGAIFSDMAGADQYLLQHSIDVAVLGMLIGRRLFQERGWIDYQGHRRFDKIGGTLVKLGIGLLLHDIGKLALPREVLDKRGKLTPEEWEIVRTHPSAGEALLPASTSFLVRAVVRSHHERWDGLGYPDGLAGERIHQFARIAAVADVFDAVTSERVYRAARPVHEARALVLGGSGTQFDPEVVAAFRSVVVPHPPGTEVLLADGRVGVVADVDGEQNVVVRVSAAGGYEEVRAPEVVGIPPAPVEVAAQQREVAEALPAAAELLAGHEAPAT